MHLLVNVVAFKIGWVSSVVGAAQEMPWLGPVAAIVAIAIHLSHAGRPATELTLIVVCATLGALFDSTLVALGWVEYSAGVFSAMLAPYWIITMWMLFATTLNVSLRWLKNRKVLAAAIGLVSGPGSYLAGNQIGAIAFVDQSAALTALAIGWAILLPLLMHVSDELDGIATLPARQRALR